MEADSQQLRDDAVERIFTGTPRWAKFILDATLAALALYTGCTASDWRRIPALAVFAAFAALNLLPIPARVGYWLRSPLALALVVVSGGPDSALLPMLVLGTLVHAAVFEGSHALIQSGASLVAVWTMLLVTPHPNPTSWVRALSLLPFLGGALLMGRWIRRTSAEMLRNTLRSRDEIVGTYRERLRELQTIRAEMTHALKNPLASIKGLAGLMQVQPERSAEHLVVLRKEVCRLESILDEYLSFSRPLTPLEVGPVDLQATLSEVAMLHEGMARERSVGIDLSQTQPLEVVGDRQKIKQIMMSLVANALEASGPRSQVELTCRNCGDSVLVAVLDRGSGVPEELLPRLTTPGLSTKEDGNGLGLTLVRMLAEQHGGKLALRNREGGGFVAEVQLPVCCESAQPLA